jgi:hypothetical protein
MGSELYSYIQKNNPEIIELVNSFTISELDKLVNKLSEEKLLEIREFKRLLNNMRIVLTNNIFDKSLIDSLQEALAYLRVINVTGLKRLIEINERASGIIGEGI